MGETVSSLPETISLGEKTNQKIELKKIVSRGSDKRHSLSFDRLPSHCPTYHIPLVLAQNDCPAGDPMRIVVVYPENEGSPVLRLLARL